MANEPSRKSENKGGREPKTTALSPCVGSCADNWGGAVAVSATNSDVSLASGAFIARAAAKER